ncbi:MAG: hypothetical protein M1825_003120 [Sarcosagium campestre]|nr:MAG: hypothetical protein M1825_003120 [Sarcosagium campestre]
MVLSRSLPKGNNPLLQPERTPPYDELVSTRRLGQTDLHVKKDHVGSVNATRPENLGMFDYAHLRAPLPKDLKGSGIFPSSGPDCYFLMRRSSDGYISATGMFKASFPWALGADEEAERKYVKGLADTSQLETAGNVWVPPASALSLAEEYKMGIWIKALLDPTPIENSQSTSVKSISPPPKYILPAAHALSPSAKASGRGRGRPRSGSPDKDASPEKKKPSSRKKASKASNTANANAASATLQTALNNAASAAESKGSEHKDTATVEVSSKVETNGEIETTHTNVKVELPSDSPDVPLPGTTEGMIAEAKQMVKEAQALDKNSSKGGKKRKAEESAEDDEVQPQKKAKTLEEQLHKEKIKTRALLGLSFTLAVGQTILQLVAIHPLMGDKSTSRLCHLSSGLITSIDRISPEVAEAPVFSRFDRLA